MSGCGEAGARAASGAGVVRSSALSFVAQAQVPPEGGAPCQDGAGGEVAQAETLVPAGLKALCDAYSRLYPDQPNPLQATTRLKYWLGGHDPLDYISMYWNPGKPEENIPSHWHYVSFGLSDLHGDGRAHAPPDRVVLAGGGRGPSGFGAELTFRLEARAPAPPPLWPAALLQALARYVFTTGNKLCAGDHISWHSPLDGQRGRVRHLLVGNDPQLAPISTPHGDITFLQLVGCTSRELRAAQRGSGTELLKLIAEDPNCGGSWLVTRMRRSSARAVGGRRGAGGGAPAELAGVSAAVRWEPWRPIQSSPEAGEAGAECAVGTGAGAGGGASPGSLSPRLQRQIKETLQRGLSNMSGDRTGPEGHTGMSTDSFEMSSIERALPQLPDLMQGLWRSSPAPEPLPLPLPGVHLVLNPEGASLLPLAVRGRLAHGRHFTWRAPGAGAVTMLSPEVGGAFATERQPYVVKGFWLQMMIPPELARDMWSRVAPLAALAAPDSESDCEGEESPPVPALPLTLCWPQHCLKISILPDADVS